LEFGSSLESLRLRFRFFILLMSCSEVQNKKVSWDSHVQFKWWSLQERELWRYVFILRSFRVFTYTDDEVPLERIRNISSILNQFLWSTRM